MIFPFALYNISCAQNSLRPLDPRDMDRINCNKIIPQSIIAPINHQPVIVGVIAFDGTRNNKNKLNKNERETIVGHIYDALEKNDSIKIRHYYTGAGTQSNPFLASLDTIIGYSLKDTSKNAAENVLDQIITLRQKQPNADVRLLVTGFSRGAATARDFMNKFEKYWKSKPRIGNTPKFYAILFDTVPAQLIKNLDLSVPVDADVFYHFVAQDERRIFFRPVLDEPQNDPYGRVHTVLNPGAHSDIGGSYPTGIGLEYTTDTDFILGQMGLLQDKVFKVESDTLFQGKNDSRWWPHLLFDSPASNNSDDITNRKPIIVKTPPLSESDILAWTERRKKLSLEPKLGPEEDKKPLVYLQFSVTQKENNNFTPKIIDEDGNCKLFYSHLFYNIGINHDKDKGENILTFYIYLVGKFEFKLPPCVTDKKYLNKEINVKLSSFNNKNDFYVNGKYCSE